MNHENNKNEFLQLLAKNDRERLYQIYDALPSSGKSLIKNLSAIEMLTIQSKKQLDKNLAKCIFVLNQQSGAGKKLPKNLGKLLFKVAQLLSHLRSSMHLLSENGTVMDLGTRANCRS